MSTTELFIVFGENNQAVGHSTLGFDGLLPDLDDEGDCARFLLAPLPNAEDVGFVNINEAMEQLAKDVAEELASRDGRFERTIQALVRTTDTPLFEFAYDITLRAANN